MAGAAAPVKRPGLLKRALEAPRLVSLENLTQRANALRLLGFLYAAIGTLILLSQWLLTPQEVSRVSVSVGGGLFLVASVAIALIQRAEPRRLLLVGVVIYGFAAMALVNYSVYGALGPFRIIYVLLFAYTGVTQRPWTSLVLVPFAALSYVAPEVVTESELPLTITGLAVSIPVWLLTAEFISRASQRLRKVNQDLVQRNEEIQAAADFQKGFVASASHELRTPLTSISGYVELLREGEHLSDEDQEHLAVVARNSERLQALVDDLLLIHAMESGRVKLSIESVPVRQLIRPIVESFRPLSAKRDIEIMVHHASDDDLSVRVDTGRTEQILTNLIGNALKFTERDGSIFVRVTEVGSEVVIEITDTGPGIPADEVPHVFDRFFRSSTSVRRAVPGTGLGLAIAKELVELQGGGIDVSSVEGQGTTFTVKLPKEN
jgi:signal transduction histidine kinase